MAQKSRSHILKSRRSQNELLFGADFGPENVQEMSVTVNGDCYRTIVLRQIDFQKMPILAKKKKSSFQMKLILTLAGM